MSILTIIFAIVLLSSVVGALFNKDSEPWEAKLREIKQKNMEEEQMENMKSENGIISVEIGTRDLLMRTLMEMGCQYKIDEDQNIFFRYQGENFFANVSDDCSFINIWDCWWLQCELHDVERLSQIKYAINESNYRTNTMTFYNVDDEETCIWVHSKKNILFIPQIPDIEGYFRAMLDEFFSVHRFVFLEVEKQQNSNNN